MGQLMLVNPKRKRRRKLSAKQRAAGFGGGGHRRKRRTRRHTVTAHANPRRRRSSGRRRKLHRNPKGGGRGLLKSATSSLMGSLMPAALGGAGALAVDVAWNFAPIPAALKTGPMAPLVKIAGAVALGAGVSKFANKRFGQAILAGYLTVTAYDMAKKLIARAMPAALPVGEYPYDLGYAQAGQFIPDETGVGAYLSAPEGYGVVEAEGMGAYLNGYGDDVS